MSAKAYASIGSILKCGTSAQALTKLCKIKSVPQLGGEPEQIETTDLEDTAQTFVLGVQSLESMTFTANYTLADYTSIKANARTAGYFELDFPNSQGKATWEGMYDVFINEYGVNDVIEMSITVTPSSTITIAAATT